MEEDFERILKESLGVGYEALKVQKKKKLQSNLMDFARSKIQMNTNETMVDILEQHRNAQQGIYFSLLHRSEHAQKRAYVIQSVMEEISKSTKTLIKSLDISKLSPDIVSILKQIEQLTKKQDDESLKQRYADIELQMDWMQRAFETQQQNQILQAANAELEIQLKGALDFAERIQRKISPIPSELTSSNTSTTSTRSPKLSNSNTSTNPNTTNTTTTTTTTSTHTTNHAKSKSARDLTSSMKRARENELSDDDQPIESKPSTRFSNLRRKSLDLTDSDRESAEAASVKAAKIQNRKSHDIQSILRKKEAINNNNTEDEEESEKEPSPPPAPVFKKPKVKSPKSRITTSEKEEKEEETTPTSPPAPREKKIKFKAPAKAPGDTTEEEISPESTKKPKLKKQSTTDAILTPSKSAKVRLSASLEIDQELPPRLSRSLSIDSPPPIVLTSAGIRSVTRSERSPSLPERTRSSMSLPVAPSEFVYSYEFLKAGKFKTSQKVNRAALESHLSDEEFEKVFLMSRDDFYKMTDWRRTAKRQEKNLF